MKRAPVWTGLLNSVRECRLTPRTRRRPAGSRNAPADPDRCQRRGLPSPGRCSSPRSRVRLGLGVRLGHGGRGHERARATADSTTSGSTSWETLCCWCSMKPKIARSRTAQGQFRSRLCVRIHRVYMDLTHIFFSSASYLQHRYCAATKSFRETLGSVSRVYGWPRRARLCRAAWPPGAWRGSEIR